MYPDSEESVNLAADLSYKYQVPVIPVNCIEMDENDIRQILARILFEFPVSEISIMMPSWVNSLPQDHWLRGEITEIAREYANNIEHIRDTKKLEKALAESNNVESATITEVDLGCGNVKIELTVTRELFYNVLAQTTGIDISDDSMLLQTLTELSEIRDKYNKIKDALDEVEATGYGIVMPSIDELSLEEPQIVRQGGRYGVRLRASAPSIHMMRADITTEVSPIVGSEKQSEDLVMYLLREFEEDPVKIWDSNIFGKSLHELVNEGLRTKLARMPDDARMRLQETLERVINEGCSGLICIIL